MLFIYITIFLFYFLFFINNINVYVIPIVELFVAILLNCLFICSTLYCKSVSWLMLTLYHMCLFLVFLNLVNCFYRKNPLSKGSVKSKKSHINRERYDFQQSHLWFFNSLRFNFYFNFFFLQWSSIFPNEQVTGINSYFLIF